MPQPILAVLIPADGAQPPKAVHVTPDLAGWWSVLGGPVQTLALPDSDAVILCREDGKIAGLPHNERATRLVAEHVPGYGSADTVNGPVLVVGRAADDQAESDVPSRFLPLTASTRGT